MQILTINIPSWFLELIDFYVNVLHLYPSRSEFIRDCVNEFLEDELPTIAAFRGESKLESPKVPDTLIEIHDSNGEILRYKKVEKPCLNQ